MENFYSPINFGDNFILNNFKINYYILEILTIVYVHCVTEKE